MTLIEHIKDDWMCRLPYRLRHSRFRGLSRPSYAILCVLYYSLKSALMLYLFAVFRIIKLVFWDIWKMLYDRLHPYEDEVEEDDEEYEEVEDTDADDIEELPFCQLFREGASMCLLIDHVEMCPDETAFIRVVDDEGYTPLYKRKVRRDKAGNRFILFNGTNHYLDDKKTQPTVIRK